MKTEFEHGDHVIALFYNGNDEHTTVQGYGKIIAIHNGNNTCKVRFDDGEFSSWMSPLFMLHVPDVEGMANV